MALVSILVVLAVASPLVVFLLEAVSDPQGILRIHVAGMALDESGVLMVELVLEYKGSVPLKDFTLEVLGEKVLVGDVVRGNYTVKVRVPELHDPVDASVKAEFKLAGLYSFSINVKESGTP